MFALAAFASLFSFTVAQDRLPSYIGHCVNENEWALTFDDGPHANTPELLKYLDEAQVKATFFVLGVQVRQPALAQTLKDTYKAGHDIACHSEDHKDMNTLTEAQIKDEVNLCIQAVKDVIGVTTDIFRPPMGNCGNTNRCREIVEGMGQTVVIWDGDSNDWRYSTLSDAEKNKTMTNIEDIIKAKPRSMITLHHDIHLFSVKMIPDMIKLIRGAGYKLVNMQQCLGGKTPIYKGVTPSSQIVKSPTDDKGSKVNNALSLSPISFSSFVFTALAAYVVNLF